MAVDQNFSEADTNQMADITKYAILATILWVVAISLSLYINHLQRAKHLIEIGTTIARSSFEKDILYRRWNASHGGVYAKQSDITSPNPHLIVSERDIFTPLGKSLTMVNPAYMTRQVHELGGMTNGVQGHITSLNPIRSENRPDPWEKQALESFERGIKEVSSVELLMGQPHLRYMKPMITENGCLPCHRKQGYKVGQIRGGISQSVPISLLETTVKGNLWPLWNGHVALCVIGLLFIRTAYLKLLGKTIALNESRAELIETNRNLKASQSRLLQSEKMASVGQLAAGVAHEINNPLAGIMQTADVLERRLTNDMQTNELAATEAGTSMANIRAFLEAREVPKMLSQIRESGNRAAAIVSNMLTFVRKGDDVTSRHDLVELLDRSVDLAGSDYDLTKKYDFRNIKIVREYAENLPLILCEGRMIQQVILNILNNGAEAMQVNGDYNKPCFILRAFAENTVGKVRIEIEDNGPGMNEETSNRIFDPFFTTKMVGQGTGLGLSVSYYIVTKHHGGEMSIESQPGKGSTFIIRLPVG
jgi:signal transduction histidine kinase